MVRHGAIVLGAVLLAAAPADAAGRRCSQMHPVRDLAPASHVKLFESANRAGGKNLRGCVMPRGPLRLIASSAEWETGYDAYHVRQVVGAAIVLDTAGRTRYGGGDATSIVHLRTGRRYGIASSCTDYGSGFCGPTQSTTAPAAYAAPDGRAVAVLFAGGEVTVAAFAASGTRTDLDTAAAGAIPPASLGLRAPDVFWANGGAARSARLP